MLAGTGVLLTGCHISTSFHMGSDPTLAADELAVKVKQSVQDASHSTVSSAQCDGALKGKVGATQRCKVTATDGSYAGVTVTTTKVEDGQIFFRIKVDDHAGANT